MNAEWCTLTVGMVAALAFAAGGICSAAPWWSGPLEPWGSNTDPTDVPRTHEQTIVASPCEYVVTQGGTMDGTNCRSPVGVYEAWEQTWESNRAVRMENIGRTDVINPWLSNGRNNFRNIQEIVDSAIEPGMSDREKAIALYYQEIAHRYHFGTQDNEVIDPVKVFNVYGYNTCGNDSICMAGLWTLAGLKVCPARLVGHCISQVFYDGRWHLMDGDMHSFYLLRDNHTIASEYDLARDHDLIKRSHTHGILARDNRSTDEWEASLYVYEGEPIGTRNCSARHTMHMVLRPGESITWRWGHLSPPKYHGRSRLRHPDTVCNGLWEYRPDFTDELWRKGAASVEGVALSPDGLAAQPGRLGTIVWTMRSPYVFVGGRLEVEGRGAEFAVSWDGKSWQQVGNDLDPLFPPTGQARYEYHLKCRLAGDARLKRLGIVNDLQMAPLAMPGMSVGTNRFVYTDESPGERKVRVTHVWVERSASRPPEAPPAPVYPPDGGEAEGTQFAFRWEEPSDPDGDAIADYHFELSERADMRWALSTNFRRLISRTRDAGAARYTLPYPGLLAPDRTYYWRVRARDEKGVWGPWSRTWSFTPRGPAVPVNVELHCDPDTNTGVLRWEPNSGGRRPARYRVYGSDEKGFSVSDMPYEIKVENQAPNVPNPFPANFVAETRQNEMVVVGVGLELPNANRAYYRVVAVDENGNRSCASDYVTAPRPFIYSAPPTRARVGRPYEYRIKCIRSLGDLRARAGLKMGFWDIEHPAFKLLEAPSWLSIDRESGVLSGTPDSPGRAHVVVEASIDREVRELDPLALSWGREKVIALKKENIGTARQEFDIEVEP